MAISVSALSAQTQRARRVASSPTVEARASSLRLIKVGRVRTRVRTSYPRRVSFMETTVVQRARNSAFLFFETGVRYRAADNERCAPRGVPIFPFFWTLFPSNGDETRKGLWNTPTAYQKREWIMLMNSLMRASSRLHEIRQRIHILACNYGDTFILRKGVDLKAIGTYFVRLWIFSR